jgi:hypothetical protein
VSVACPAGKYPLGGGVDGDSNWANLRLMMSYPAGNTWTAYVHVEGNQLAIVRATAVCAKVG